MDSAVHDIKVQLKFRYIEDMTVNKLVSKYLKIPIRYLIGKRCCMKLQNRGCDNSAVHEM